MGSEGWTSNGQVEAAASEALQRRRLLLKGVLRVQALLGLSLDLLAALLLVVLAFHVLELAGESLDLILVLVDLGLVHVELGSHSLHLAGLLLEILLVDAQLLGDLRARLPGKEVFELDVELLFLLDDHVFLHHLLGLLDEAFLEGLDLLEHLPGVGVSALELAPPVVVEGVLEFLGERLDLESLGQELLLQVVDLLPQITDLGGL